MNFDKWFEELKAYALNDYAWLIDDIEKEYYKVYFDDEAPVGKRYNSHKDKIVISGGGLGIQNLLREFA